MIPKIIHQMWIGPHPMPIDMINTWIEKNPTWEHILWTEDELNKRYPNGFKNQGLIDSCLEWCGKCDVYRYEILSDYGGFFIDADCICTNSLDDHFLNHSFFSCYENEIQRPGMIATGYMGAEKGCSLMKLCTDKISTYSTLDHRITKKMAWELSGPLLLTQMVKLSKYPAFIYPSHVFIPKHYTGETYLGDEKSYSDQLWSTTSKHLSSNNTLEQSKVIMANIDKPSTNDKD